MNRDGEEGGLESGDDVASTTGSVQGKSKFLTILNFQATDNFYVYGFGSQSSNFIKKDEFSTAFVSKNSVTYGLGLGLTV